MKTIYEVVRIKQVIKEVESSEKFVIRSPQDAADVAAQFIGDDDSEVFFVMCLKTRRIKWLQCIVAMWED
ncbi:DNA repair protein RadC [Fictibacillus barbaricus]|uniref:DNA repair protein RadC n=1 Tax=Fictibacillus barbaricus TaxID=182136 RepID=A0ABU1U3V7_9BACL|nr:DNA repair protein RadC [Fictibacillus barbaricus]